KLLCQTRGRLTPGEVIEVEPGRLRLLLVEKTAEAHWLAEPSEPGRALALLQRHGQMPLPPYIRKGRAVPDDAARYPTLYARRPGAVAAPTAGLHFTPRVFEALQERGIGRAFVTLHVGPGTFQPIQVPEYRTHRMHAEWGELPAPTADTVAAC